MQPHINNPELRRLFTVAQILLEAQLQQQASESDTTKPEAEQKKSKGENDNGKQA